MRTYRWRVHWSGPDGEGSFGPYDLAGAERAKAQLEQSNPEYTYWITEEQ